MGTLMTTFTTAGPIELTVELGVRSDIWITAVDRNEASVDIQPREPSRALDARVAEHTVVEFSGGRLTVKLRQWRGPSWFSDGGAVDVTIEVPIGSSLDVSSGMGALDADGEFGAVSLRTGMGGIRIDQCTRLRAKTGQGDITIGGAVGHAEITTGTGKVRAGEIEGSAAIKNSNGETLITEVTGELRVSASNGDIDVARVGGNVVAKASNGAVRIGEVARGTITVATASGSIDVGVRTGTAAWLDLSSNYGRVYNSLAAADGAGAAENTVQVRARNAYGDITVHRAGGEE